MVEVEKKKITRSRRNPLISFVTVSEGTATSKRRPQVLRDTSRRRLLTLWPSKISVCNNLNSKSSLTGRGSGGRGGGVSEAVAVARGGGGGGGGGAPGGAENAVRRFDARGDLASGLLLRDEGRRALQAPPAAAPPRILPLPLPSETAVNAAGGELP